MKTRIPRYSPSSTFFLLFVIAVASLIAGCHPSLSFQKQYTLAAYEIIPLPIDAVGHTQTIHVKLKSINGADFTCHVYLLKDDANVERALTTGATSKKILADSSRSTKATLSAKIPANEAAVVRVAAHSDKVTVDVSIHN